MGKRSDFVRVERDYYKTPYAAVPALLPHLEPNTRFCEPCAGDGALIDHLTKHGHVCASAWDIEPQREDIAQHFNWRSLNAAQEHLKALQRKGVIVLRPGVSRGILRDRAGCMNENESHCIASDAERFAAADDLAAWAIEHAAELAARDRIAAERALKGAA